MNAFNTLEKKKIELKWMVPTRTEKEEKRESTVKKTQISICARGPISFVSHRSGKEVRPQHALSKVSN